MGGSVGLANAFPEWSICSLRHLLQHPNALGTWSPPLSMASCAHCKVHSACSLGNKFRKCSRCHICRRRCLTASIFNSQPSPSRRCIQFRLAMQALSASGLSTRDVRPTFMPLLINIVSIYSPFPSCPFSLSPSDLSLPFRPLRAIGSVRAARAQTLHESTSLSSDRRPTDPTPRARALASLLVPPRRSSPPPLAPRLTRSSDSGALSRRIGT